MDEDLKDCLSVQRQPSRKFALPGKTSREMAEELVSLTGGDRDTIQSIVLELLYYHPEQSIDWYLEQAVNHLHKRYKN